MLGFILFAIAVLMAFACIGFAVWALIAGLVAGEIVGGLKVAFGFTLIAVLAVVLIPAFLLSFWLGLIIFWVGVFLVSVAFSESPPARCERQPARRAYEPTPPGVVTSFGQYKLTPWRP